MPSFFNVSQDPYSEAIESGDPFKQHMTYLQQSFDQIMHENYQLEQRVNRQFLHLQTTAPGTAQEYLSNSRSAMDRILKVKHAKEDVTSGQASASGYNIAAQVA